MNNNTMTNQNLNQNKEHKDTPIDVENIPQDVQEAILSPSVGTTIRETGHKYLLHVDKMGELLDETGLVMIGLTHPRDYIRNLQKRLSVDFDLAKKIGADINEQIFRPIRESLKKIHNINEQTTDNQQPTTVRDKSQIPQSKIEQKEIRDTGYEIRDTISEESPILRLKREPAPATKDGERPFAPLQMYSSEEAPEEQKPPPLGTAPETERTTIKAPTAQQTWEPEQPEKGAPPPENLPVETKDQQVPPLGEYPSDKKETSAKIQKPAEKQKPPPQTTDYKLPIQAKAEEQLPAIIPGNSIEEKLTRPFQIPKTETEYRGDPYREPID